MVTQNLDEWPLPIVDIAPYLSNPNSAEAMEACSKVADALHKYSALAIRDPRVSEDDNTRFLDMMESYFAQPYDSKLKDARPEYGYQVGSTPELTEVPRCGGDSNCVDFVESMPAEDRPLSFDQADPKWRFFWTIGERLSKRHARISPEAVIPENFPEWKEVMDHWGGLLYEAVNTCSQMAGKGFNFSDPDVFSTLMRGGPHLLAPTGSDLDKYGKLGTVLAGFHYDLNFLTIHGKSRYPGLYIWPRNGKKTLVKIPDGCLLVQAGKQMEYLTGGHVMAGYHEVVVVDKTLDAIARTKSTYPERPLWRVSSTLFAHIMSDQTLKPLFQFESRDNSLYPPIEAGDQVSKELQVIQLLKD